MSAKRKKHAGEQKKRITESRWGTTTEEERVVQGFGTELHDKKRKKKEGGALLVWEIRRESGWDRLQSK